MTPPEGGRGKPDRLQISLGLGFDGLLDLGEVRHGGWVALHFGVDHHARG
jgi:hypothetical protein